MRDFFISIAELKNRIGTSCAPMIFDVRRRPLFDAENTILPTARWRDHTASDLWAGTLEPDTDLVIHCVHGHNVSQAAAATLRARGMHARVLEGGIEGWRDADGPLILKDALPNRDEDLPSVWVTHTSPQIDLLACAWLVRRFIDRDATFLYVEPEQVVAVADELGGIPFGVPGVTIVASSKESAFTSCLARFELAHSSLSGMANIVDAASLDEPHRVPEVAGLHALMRGALALSGPDEHDVLQRTLPIFDALHAGQLNASERT